VRDPGAPPNPGDGVGGPPLEAATLRSGAQVGQRRGELVGTGAGVTWVAVGGGGTTQVMAVGVGLEEHDDACAAAGGLLLPGRPLSHPERAGPLGHERCDGVERGGVRRETCVPRAHAVTVERTRLSPPPGLARALA
jgi:hypothetical protein